MQYCFILVSAGKTATEVELRSERAIAVVAAELKVNEAKKQEHEAGTF